MVEIHTGLTDFNIFVESGTVQIKRDNEVIKNYDKVKIARIDNGINDIFIEFDYGKKPFKPETIFISGNMSCKVEGESYSGYNISCEEE